MEDTKQILKEAKEAIKNKNYGTSSKLCKLILEEDANNYMALVFLGVSLLQTGHHSKALKAFQDAVKINSSNPLAWNGLVNYYEKVDTKESKTELATAYICLLNIESNEKKLIEYTQKLHDLFEYGDVTNIVLAIYSLLKSGKCSEVIEIASSLANILSKNKDLSPDLTPIYEEVLNIVLNNPKTVSVKYFNHYLNLLYKLNRKEQLYDSARKMHSMFPSDWISLKWLCKIFNESYVESNVMTANKEIAGYSETLLKSEPQSTTALFTKSILLIDQNKLIEARDLLYQIVNSLPALLHSWILLLRTCLKLHLFDEAIQATDKVGKLLQSGSESKKILKNAVDVAMIEALSRSLEEKDLERALQLYDGLDDEMKRISVCHIIRTNINLKKFTQAKLLLDDLQHDCDSDITHKLLSSQLLYKQEKYEEALKLLENKNVEESEWWLQIGRLYWHFGQYDKSLMAYLKATKLDSNNYMCFLLLGDYYKKVNDLDKARRCYEKSFKLNTRCSEAGIELSEIYRKMGNWDANLFLLQALTRGTINKNNSWAWMQLGLHYQEQQNYDDAIINLRLVIRVDESIINCWESLADAYLAKGAFTSALKCYEKASLISEDSLYPLIQMATIKKILGDFTEARSDFERILKLNNLYIPALKGMAETCLFQAKECLREQRLGACRSQAQFAADYLIISLQERNDLGCLWKLLGDIFIMVTNLPEQYSCLLVSASFVENKKSIGNSILEKNDLFTLAAKCYYKSVGFSEDNTLMWQDLAACYFLHSHCAEKDEISGDLIKKAQIIANYCTSKNPTHWQHWNLLGTIAMSSDSPNYKLAQHSFIKAILADNNSAVSWSNLGTLYFILGDYKLANEAYSQAQRADPNYVNSWIGQALLAESLTHEDAMDLFRHSTQLGFHKQGALGYAHWVCKTLKELPLDVNSYAIYNMHAVPVACDAITWYSERNPMDGTAWNMLGILRERMSLKLGAIEAFKSAVSLSKGKHRDLARVNYGRLLAVLNKNSEAVDIFTEIETATFNSGSGLAFALFKDKRYKESYETYESTLHWLSEEPRYQSELLVALASMAYMFDGPEAAKTLLFQSIQLENSSPWCFYATLVLGLLHRDFKFSILILSELKKFKVDKKCAQHIAILSGHFYLLQGNTRTAIREISKMIYRYPDQAVVWLTLSSVLMRSCLDWRSLEAAAKCAQVAMKLGETNMDVTKVLCLASLSFLAIGNIRDALSMAQKAVHCYPDLAESWTVFATALSKEKRVTDNHVKDVFKFAMCLDNNEELNNWIGSNFF